MRKSTTIAVDLAKNVFQVAVSHHPGKVAESHRLSRKGLLPFFAARKPAIVLLEASKGGTPGTLGRRAFFDN